MQKNNHLSGFTWAKKNRHLSGFTLKKLNCYNENKNLLQKFLYILNKTRSKNQKTKAPLRFM